MRIGAHATIVAASVAAGAVGLIGSAFAADMTGAEIKAFLSGKTVKGNTLCADWRERPNNPCTRYDKTGDTVSVLDTVSGQTRAKIVKTAPGNAEKLAP